jgi:hypothetical protein
MALGRKTGGRTAGTPNKRTVEVAERLTALGCDPIEGMARLAMDESNSADLRGRMFSELAQYVAPKRKAIEHSATDGGSFEFTWMTPQAVRDLTMPELVNKVLERIAAGDVEPDAVAPLMERLRGEIAVRN